MCVRALVPLLLLSTAHAFVLTPSRMNTSNDHGRSVLTLRMATSERGAAIGRRSLIVTTAGGLAALIGSKPADAEMLKAACTTIDCPAPKTESLDLVDNMVKPSEYTGKGATFKVLSHALPFRKLSRAE